jgi:RND family efflux transporter MFP subunit
MKADDSLQAQVDTMQLAEQTLELEFTRRGVLQPFREIRVHAEATGRAIKRHAAVGTVLNGGDPILELDGALTKIQLDEAVAREKSAQVQLEEAEQQVTDAGESEDEDLIRELKARRDAAEAALEVARAQAAEAQQLFDARIIRAPVDGTLSQLLVNEGEFAASGRPAAEMVVTNPLRAVVALTAQEVVHVGDDVECEIRLTRGAATAFPAQLVRIAPVADPRTRRFAVELEVDNQDGTLRAGMRVNVTFRCRSKDTALLMPRRALTRRGESLVCFRIDETAEGDIAHQLKPLVRSLPGKGDWLLIRSGLKAGDRLAVSGHLLLDEGVRVSTGERQGKDG